MCTHCHPSEKGFSSFSWNYIAQRLQKLEVPPVSTPWLVSLTCHWISRGHFNIRGLQDHHQIQWFTRTHKAPKLSCLLWWLIKAREYRVKSSSRKDTGVKSGKNHYQASKSPLPVRSHRMYLIPPNNDVWYMEKVANKGYFSEPACPGFHWALAT